MINNTKKYFEAHVKIKNQSVFGSSYEHPLFALHALSNKCIDLKLPLSAQHEITVTEYEENTNTEMVEFRDGMLKLTDTYHVLDSILEDNYKNNKL